MREPWLHHCHHVCHFSADCASYWASQVVLVVKKLPADVEDLIDGASIPGWGRFPGGGDGNPLQYSCLENPKDRGAWQATVHWVAKSQI